RCTRTVGRIATAALPDPATADRSSARGSPSYLLLPLVELSRQLRELATLDPRFERAAMLASELERELAELSGEAPPLPARRRQPARAARRAQVSERTLSALRAEREALRATVKRLEEMGVTISTQQLSDLRLGERTRRIFREAGLLSVQDVAELPSEDIAAIA